MKTTHKILSLVALCHLAFIPGYIYGEPWMFVASFAWYLFLAATVMSAGHHRFYAHKAFKAGSWYPYYVNIFNLFTAAGPMMTRAALHRYHHAYSDLEKDPTTPSFNGYWKTRFMFWDDVNIDRKFFKGLVNDPLLKFFKKHHFKLHFVIISLLFLIDPLFLVFAYCVPTVMSYHFYGMTNWHTHKTGSPKNVPWLSLLTGGEGDHEDHHKDSSNPRLSKRFDTGFWFIKMIRTD